jgi:hypothetical protein
MQKNDRRAIAAAHDFKIDVTDPEPVCIPRCLGHSSSVDRFRRPLPPMGQMTAYFPLNVYK